MPVVGVLELAELALLRAGEGALLEAEQLALEQLRRQRRAVDLDEGPVAAARELEDRARDELLAGAALAAHEHGDVGVRDLLDDVAHLPHLRVVAEEQQQLGLGARAPAQPLDLLLAARASRAPSGRRARAPRPRRACAGNRRRRGASPRRCCAPGRGPRASRPGTSGMRCLMRRSVSRPSMPGSTTSSVTRSGRDVVERRERLLAVRGREDAGSPAARPGPPCSRARRGRRRSPSPGRVRCVPAPRFSASSAPSGVLHPELRRSPATRDADGRLR